MRGKRLLSLFLCLILLTSCGLLDKLGFDTYDYMSEKVTQTHKTDSEIAVKLAGVLAVLITDSPELPTFENMGEAIRLYRDAVLDFMLETEYSKYSGNNRLMGDAVEAHPEYSFTQIIPENDFEATMYRYFGGDVMISHKDTGRYRYLKDLGAYIPTKAVGDSGYSVKITAVTETDKTYRVWFCTEAHKIVSDEYFALIIKRDDGTLYIKKLLHAADVK